MHDSPKPADMQMCILQRRILPLRTSSAFACGRRSRDPSVRGDMLCLCCAAVVSYQNCHETSVSFNSQNRCRTPLIFHTTTELQGPGAARGARNNKPALLLSGRKTSGSFVVPTTKQCVKHEPVPLGGPGSESCWYLQQRWTECHETEALFARPHVLRFRCGKSTSVPPAAPSRGG